MEDWQNFYLQKMGIVSGGASYDVYESVSQWGIWCKEIPFKIYEKVKEPTKRSWYDQNGDDEYIPANGLYMDSYTMKVSLGCKLIGSSNNYDSAEVNDVRTKVGQFLSYLRTSGMMKMYSSYTRIGRQNVRLQAINDDAKWVSKNGEEWLIFSVVFKVNDPTTDITLDNE